MGSKEGWKPRDDSQDVLNSTEGSDKEDGNDEISARPFPQQNSTLRKRQRPQQRLEDFMDEQDHDEWGGPTSIRKEYKDSSTAAAAANVPSKSKASTTTTQETTVMGSSTMAQNLELEEQQWRNITVEPPAHVGHRLLRLLGWREGNSAAYVPEQATTSKKGTSQKTEEDTEAKIVLSSKKLRKIQLQQRRVKIPPPKLDTCGLGYEPYQNAPEFQAYQEKRKKLAQQRAKLDHHNANNVYRVSDVLGQSNTGHDIFGGIHNNGEQQKQDDLPSNSHRQHQRLDAEDPDDDAYASYETVEDFIGNKSVGGFALREDADQAYDDEDPQTLTKVSNKVKIDTEAYNDEIYEHQSSGDEDDHNMSGRNTIGQGLSRTGANRTHESLAVTNHAKATASKKDIPNNIGSDFAGVLSSFADTSGGLTSLKSDNTKAGGVTADGRAPLAGFVLGGTFASHSMPKRYRGPDIPRSYQVTRHVFSENEHPTVLKALSRAVQLEAVDAKRRQALDEALQAKAASNAPSRRLQLLNAGNNSSNSSSQSTQRAQGPMAGGAFVGLAQAMKNRFTSVVETPNDGKKAESGLRVPSKDTKMDSKSRNNGQSSRSPPDKNEHEEGAKTEIKLSRTTRSFAPDRILCKRFYVPVPTSSSDNSSAIKSGRVTESSYFQQEILQPAVGTGSENGKKSEVDDLAKFTQQAKSIMATMFNEDGTMKEDDLTLSKPSQVPMDIKKSIFEPESEDEDSEIENELVQSSSDGKTAHETLNDAKILMTDETMAKVLPEKTDVSISHGATSNGENTREFHETEETAVVPHKERDKKKKQKKPKRSRSRKHRRYESDSDDESSTSTDLDRDSGSARNETRKRHRDHKDRRKHKHKKKKRSKKNRKEDE